MSKNHTNNAGFIGSTKVLVINHSKEPQIITLKELTKRFHNGEIIKICSYNEKTNQNEWKTVTNINVSDEKVKELGTENYVYNLTVEDNHNFYANGILVSCFLFLTKFLTTFNVSDNSGVYNYE